MEEVVREEVTAEMRHLIIQIEAEYKANPIKAGPQCSPIVTFIMTQHRSSCCTMVSDMNVMLQFAVESGQAHSTSIAAGPLRARTVDDG